MIQDTPSALFGVVLFLAAGQLTLRATRAINLQRQCVKWPKVQAVILSAEVTAQTDSEGTAYRPQFSFRYSVAGRDYVSMRHTNGMPFEHTEAAAQDLAARFPVNSSVEVAVKPGQPDFAMLDTGVPRQWVIIRRVSCVAALVGLSLTLKAALAA